MPKAARKTADIAGGPIKQGSDNVKVEGLPAARKGDAIQAHGDSPHSNPVIAEGSSKVKINGKPAASRKFWIRVVNLWFLEAF